MSIPYLPGLLDGDPNQLPPFAGAGRPLPRIAPPAPTAAPITQQIRPYRGSLFDRFKQALMPTPPGMQGMLSPEQERAGRNQGLLDAGLSLLDSSGPTTGPAPSLMQAVGRGIRAGQAGFAQHAQDDVQGGLLQDEQSQQKALLATRQTIAQKYQITPGMSPEDRDATLEKLYTEYARIGDTEMLKQLGAVMPSLRRTSAIHEVPNVGLVDLSKIGPDGKPLVVVPSVAAAKEPIRLPNVAGTGKNVGKAVTLLIDPITKQPIQEIVEAPAPKADAAVKYENFQTPEGKTVFIPEGEGARLGYVKVGTTKPGAGSTSLPAPMAAKVGQFGEMVKKAADLMPTMDALGVSLPGSAAQDVAEHGVHVPLIGTLPGSKGIGAILLNKQPDYAKYQAQLSPFVLAAAHALSGARINQDQVEQIRNSIEFKPGDSKGVRDQKAKNLMDLINSIGGSLPQDAIASQEDQMDGALLSSLKAYGYKGATRKAATPPAGKTTLSYEDWLKSRKK